VHPPTLFASAEGGILPRRGGSLLAGGPPLFRCPVSSHGVPYCLVVLLSPNPGVKRCVTGRHTFWPSLQPIRAIPITGGTVGRHEHQHRAIDDRRARWPGGRGARPYPHPYRRRPQPGTEARAAYVKALTIDRRAEGRSTAAAGGGCHPCRTRPQLRCRKKHNITALIDFTARPRYRHLQSCLCAGRRNAGRDYQYETEALRLNAL
jgi:hypothetical protein